MNDLQEHKRQILQTPYWPSMFAPDCKCGFSIEACDKCSGNYRFDRAEQVEHWTPSREARKTKESDG